MIRRKILSLIKQKDPDNPLEYVHDIVRDYAREKLDQHILDCRDCDICSEPKSITWGDTKARLLIVSESVCEEQSGLGRSVYPLQDCPQRSLLESALGEYYNKAFYINAVNCMPCRKTGQGIAFRLPSKTEVENCRVFTDFALDLVRPEAVLLLGPIALNLFEEKTMSEARGEIISVQGIPAVATYHPDYFSRVGKMKSELILRELREQFREDVKRILQYL